jgi:hypothetical protein
MPAELIFWQLKASLSKRLRKLKVLRSFPQFAVLKELLRLLFATLILPAESDANVRSDPANRRRRFIHRRACQPGAGQVA